MVQKITTPLLEKKNLLNPSVRQVFFSLLFVGYRCMAHPRAFSAASIIASFIEG